MRIRRVSGYLTENGHDVHYLCENDGSQPDREVIDGVTVERVKSKNNNKFRQAFFHATLIDYHWYQKIKKVVADSSFDLLHVVDLEPLRTVILANKTELPIVADLRELYPESMLAHKNSMSLHQRFLRPVWRYKRLERSVLSQADGLIAESSVAESHYTENFDIDPDNVVVSRNVPDLQLLREIAEDVQPVDYPEEFIIVYAGTFTAQRDLATLLRSVAILAEEGLSIRLLMLGDGAERERLESLAEELGISDCVEFTGRVSFERMFDYLAASDAGISICKKGNKDSECAISNKIFQYMYMGVPVIAGDLPATTDIIEETDAGLLVPPEDPDKMAQAIRKLYSNRDLSEKLGDNGHRAVVEEYNFANEGRSLLEIYQKVL